MFVKNIKKKSFSEEEEEDSDLIINNDEFFIFNDFKENNNLLFLSKNKISKKINNEQKNNYQNNNRILLKNPKYPKLINNDNNFQNNNVKSLNKNTNNEEKTIFSKITEDLYLDSLNKIKPKKNIFDINKIKDDNYNKLTVENYLFTCADKENSKNNKIINDFIERKNKEHICKKIAINQKNNTIDNGSKKLSSDHKKFKRSKGARSPEQFLDDQKLLEEKHKQYIDKLIKLHNEEINLCLKDRPTISKQSEKLANMNKNSNKNVHIKLYEEYNIKKKNIEEKSKVTFTLDEYIFGSKKKLDNEQIIESAKRLYKDYEKMKNNLNENKMKKLNDIKNLSSNSLINKNSKDIISKRFIEIYKKVLNELFQKNINDIFDFAFGDFLLFIFKLQLVEKDYNIIINNNKQKYKNILLNINESSKTKNEAIKNNKTEMKQYPYKKDNWKEEQKNSFRKIRNISPEEERNRKNMFDISNKILKRNTFLKTKSVGKKSINNNETLLENEPELKQAKEAWKIITKNKTFNEEILGSSKRVLLFFLSLCGIYKGNINDILIKKEFPILLNEPPDNIISIQLSQQIYKNFFNYRNSIFNNAIEKNKPKKKRI